MLGERGAGTHEEMQQEQEKQEAAAGEAGIGGGAGGSWGMGGGHEKARAGGFRSPDIVKLVLNHVDPILSKKNETKTFCAMSVERVPRNQRDVMYAG